MVDTIRLYVLAAERSARTLTDDTGQGQKKKAVGKGEVFPTGFSGGPDHLRNRAKMENPASRAGSRSCGDRKIFACLARFFCLPTSPLEYQIASGLGGAGCFENQPFVVL